jgi:flagellar assembly protein FliH
MSGDVLKSHHVRVNAMPLVVATAHFSPRPESARSSTSASTASDSVLGLAQDEYELAQMEVQASQAESQRIIQTAEQQAVEILRLAQQQGFEAGYAAGRTSGEGETRAMLLMTEHILEQSRLWQREMVAQSEASVRSLIIEIAEKLFGKGFELPPEQLWNVVSRALDKARELGKNRIRMNPLDITTVQPLAPANLVFVPDETITCGGCLIEAEFGTVDGRVETQLTEIKRSLTGTQS